MSILFRKPMIGALTLLASLSAPLAFAQDATTAEQTPPAEQSAAPTEATQVDAAPAEVADAMAPTAAPVKKSWAEVDVDKDGALSKTEAGTVPALGAVFDQADGNADGMLTADEYRAYAAKVQGGTAGNGGGAGK